MSIRITRNINIQGYGKSMMGMGMMPMGGMYYRPTMSLFGNGFCSPMMSWGMSKAMGVGMCVGALAATPGLLKATGKGLKWAWDHSIGWLIKKIKGKKSEKAEQTKTQST